ncbi:hypothetical protein ACFFIF_09275 [Vagococcus entomophilus]|uniref:Uncharacterized protein n=1 Tax=Vagococcus entomophilus TaxID=1160095 RepID=A0A430AGK2_9ENTE|nr:hypothetical protein [Vagococcus entomophilus]RSU07056.1 hypothetical protein CBF30_07300 [Vagococcus entomophilus]
MKMKWVSGLLVAGICFSPLVFLQKSDAIIFQLAEKKQAQTEKLKHLQKANNVVVQGEGQLKLVKENEKEKTKKKTHFEQVEQNVATTLQAMMIEPSSSPSTELGKVFSKLSGVSLYGEREV